ncbi:MAG: hypothetical protein Kow0031_01960 [Anaerolineae bacterium]
MKQTSNRYLMLALLAAALLVSVIASPPISAQGTDGVVITSPASGETVSDVVVVTGAVDFPDFLKYDFFLKVGDNMIWIATGYSPVINGNLLRLDTKTLADGGYQVVVRKVTSDSNYTDVMGPSFTVNNGQTAPNPFSEVEATFLYPAPGKATLRARNCTGEDFFTDYNSPEGFKSSGEISLAPWGGEGVCPYADVALIPGEYRGTAKGGAQVEGLSFTFNAEAGKVYEMNYNGMAAGQSAIYIVEVEPDERASTDTGGLSPDDPTRAQTESDMAGGAAMDDKGGSDAAMAPADTGAKPSDAAQAVLPDTGQAATNSAPFAVVAVGLIALMLVGGLFAIKRGKQTA